MSAAPVSYRLAVDDDVAELAVLSDRLLGDDLLDWSLVIGDGSSRDVPLAIVGERAGRVVAAAGVSPLQLGSEQVVTVRARRDHGVEQFPWWKLRGLAVEPELQGQGVARELLRRVVERAPSSITGLYGNVVFGNSPAVDWYLRQGFHVAATVGLSGRTQSMFLTSPVPEEVLFRASMRTLRDHLAGTPRARADGRLLQAEFQAAVHKFAANARKDLGYRLFARSVAEATAGRADCGHLAVCRQPAVVLGWDPEHLRVCADCSIGRAGDAVVRGNDDEDVCDGCGGRDDDVILTAAALEEELLIVNAGLCPSCRAGQLPGK